MAVDDYSEPTLRHGHLGLHSFGDSRCLNIGWFDQDALTTDEQLKQYIEVKSVEVLEGKPFEGFEETFFAGN